MSLKSSGLPGDEEEEEYWLRLLSDLGSEPSVPMSMRPPPASPLFVPEDFRNDGMEDVNLNESMNYNGIAQKSYDNNSGRYNDQQRPSSAHSRTLPTSSQTESNRSNDHRPSHHIRSFSDGGPNALHIPSRQSYAPEQTASFGVYPESNEDLKISTPNYPPPLPPKLTTAHISHTNKQQANPENENENARPEDDEEEEEEHGNEQQQELPDMWGESDEYISDQIDFIFCSDNKEDYEYEDPYGASSMDALALCRSSLNHLQPVLRNAVGYAAGKVHQAGQALYMRSTASATTSFATSKAIANKLNDTPRGALNDDSPRLGASLGSLHHTILFLSQHLDSAALSKYVRTASGTVVTLRDIAVMHIARYVRSNVYLSSFVGCVHESTLFMVDRLRAGVELYSHILQGDDPEKMHLELLKDKPDWQHLLLRCSMASLTWKQRQLIEETRDGGSINSADFRRLVQAQILEFDRQRVAKIAKEYFYIPQVEHSSSGSASGSGSTSLAIGGIGSENEGVNPAALKTILSDTATIDMLSAQSNTKSPNYTATNTTNDYRTTTRTNNTSPTITTATNNNSTTLTTHTISSTIAEVDNNTDLSDQAVDVLKSNIHSWLVEEATLGDEDAQYALARFFTPPGFAEDPCCAVCERQFSITLFRHHCRFCGRSVCDDHSTARRCIYRYGLVTPVRVCVPCAESIDETHRMDGIIWRDLRVSAYLRNKLIPYFIPTVDRGIDKVFRVADYSIAVARNALTYNFPAKLALDTVEVLKRYGLTGFTGLLLRKDFLESVELLKRISGMESMFSLSLHELTACVYYKLAIERGLRGSHPDSERLAHAPRTSTSTSGSNSASKKYTSSGGGGGGSGGSPRVSGAKSSGSVSAYNPASTNHTSSSHTNNNSNTSSSNNTNANNNDNNAAPPAATAEGEDYECKDAHNMDVQLAIRFAPLALNIIYEENPVDCQRLAKLQGWDTVFTNAETDLAPEQPCYTLFATSFPPVATTSEKTSSGGGGGKGGSAGGSSGSGGAGKSAAGSDKGAKGQQDASTPPPVRPSVLEAVLVIRGTQTIQDVVTDIRAAPLHFPPPAEDVDAALRGTNAHSSGGLTMHTASEESLSPGPAGAGPTSSKKWDWTAVPSHHTYACGGMVRAAMYVLREVGPALRRLQAEGYQISIVGHSLGGAVAALLTYLLAGVAPTVQCVTYGCPSCVNAATSDLLKGRVLSVVLHDDVISRITPQSIRLLMRELMVFREQMFQHLHQEWVDVLRRASGLWTPRWRMVTAAPRGSSSGGATAGVGSAGGGRGSGSGVKDTERLLSQARNAELDVPLRAVGGAAAGASASSGGAGKSMLDDPAAGLPAWDAPDPASSNSGASKSGGKVEAVAVMVEEEELAQLWLPGRVLHIYIHNGQCLAAEVSRNFPDLRTIVLQGNIFEDHRSEKILSALLEVRAVRQAPRAAPAWQSYHDSDVCYCCNSNFTWNSTFTGQAQEFRDKYNCRYCGHLVCDPCSTQRRAMPQLGHMFAKRICDKCLYKGDYASV